MKWSTGKTETSAPIKNQEAITWSDEQKEKKTETSALITERPLHEVTNWQNWDISTNNREALHEVMNRKNWHISTNNWEAITWSDEQTKLTHQHYMKWWTSRQNWDISTYNWRLLHEVMNRQNWDISTNNWEAITWSEEQKKIETSALMTERPLHEVMTR